MDSSLKNSEHVINYEVTDDNLRSCRISFYKDDDPAYFMVKYQDSVKYYFIIEE